MRFIRPIAFVGLEQLSPTTWRTIEEQGLLVVGPRRDPAAFLCFLIRARRGTAAPQVAFDRGRGFDEASAVFFKAFPLGFYHLPPASLEGVQRLRIRIGEQGAVFDILVFEARQPLPIAALHYLFHLRYQKVNVLKASGARQGWLGFLRSNAAHIAGYFASVGRGEALPAQQQDGDVLARIVVAQTIRIAPTRTAMEQRWTSHADRPLISFVSPAYETPPAYLRDLVDSFTAEQAPYAELILVDDGSRKLDTVAALAEAGGQPRVRVVTMPRNGGIAAATNGGIAAARGEWLSFIDHDDAFASGAIPAIARAIADHPSAVFLYTDELVTDEALAVVGAFCKPAFDPVLLTGVNYINHLSVFRRDRVEALGGLALDREGSQDYDLLLRYLVGVADGDVVHIPYLAYRWRRSEKTYSAVHHDRSVNNARLAIIGTHGGGEAGVAVEPSALMPDLHRLRFRRAARPLVSVVIPNRDSLGLIRRVTDDLLHRTDYPDLEIVVADNGSADPAVLAFYEARRSERFRAEIVAEPFNFSAMCNRGARCARGEAILFLNNDIEVTEPGWLAEMVECLAFPSTGIVGAKLLYPNGRLQHAGVIVGLGEAAGHWFVNDASDDVGPMGRLAVRQTLSAVTGACMLVTRRCFDALGGFDETVFPVAYNDIDLCLRARPAGFRTVWTPFATLLHHESASRGSDESGANRERLAGDIAKLQQRHGTKTLVDGAYSPFYDRRHSRPHLVVPQEQPEARPAVFA